MPISTDEARIRSFKLAPRCFLDVTAIISVNEAQTSGISLGKNIHARVVARSRVTQLFGAEEDGRDSAGSRSCREDAKVGPLLVSILIEASINGCTSTGEKNSEVEGGGPANRSTELMAVHFSQLVSREFLTQMRKFQPASLGPPVSFSQPSSVSSCPVST
ncbi:hypothetical protein K0M31_005034 [Melipona bicolor]|uniref:Uncharacterized protein n=1 Tax=Melipona bicolor TaxID=60889 RepID=A0AA40FVY9_9HYME|nr:hypothetical protein K0M31_005034 [Melipona bicolor]